MDLNKKVGMNLFLSFFLIITLLCTVPVLAKDEEPFLPEPFIDDEKYKYDNLTWSDKNVDVEFLTPIISKLNDTKTIQSKFKSDNNFFELLDEDLDEFKVLTKLTFKDVFFNNPILFHNGLWVKNAILTPIGTAISFLVDSFSTYTIYENNFNGTFSNTTISLGNITLLPDAVLIVSFTGNTSSDLSYYNNIGGYVPAAIQFNDSCIPTSTVAESADGCPFLSGTQNYAIPTNSNIALKSNFTVSCWVRRTTDIAYDGFCGKATFSSNRGYDLAWDDVTNNYYLFLFDNASVSRQINSNVGIDQNWHFLLAQFNNTNVSLYVDGVWQNSLDRSWDLNVLNDSNANFTIGRTYANFNGNYINGYIDEVRLYNRVLSASEILLLNSSIPQSKYYLNGEYTSIIYNRTDYNPNIVTDVVYSVTFNITPNNNLTVFGRSSNTCSTLNTTSYSSTVKGGDMFNFTPSTMTGQCKQFLVNFYGNTNFTDQISSYRFVINHTYRPTVETIQIWNETLIGTNATFIVNSTDVGSIIFKAYLNGTLNRTGQIFELLNGSIATIFLNVSSATEGDWTLYVSAQANNSDVLSTIILNSANITFTIPSPISSESPISSSSSSGGGGSASIITCKEGQVLKNNFCITPLLTIQNITKQNITKSENVSQKQPIISEVIQLMSMFIFIIFLVLVFWGIIYATSD